jgi:hypothetical protein
LDEQPISVCLGDPGPWVRCLAQAASGAEGVFRGVSTLVFHDKKVLSVGARPRLPPRALVRKKVSFQLISTVYGKNNRVFSATIIADGKRPFNLDNHQWNLAKLYAHQADIF